MNLIIQIIVSSLLFILVMICMYKLIEINNRLDRRKSDKEEIKNIFLKITTRIDQLESAIKRPGNTSLKNQRANKDFEEYQRKIDEIVAHINQRLADLERIPVNKAQNIPDKIVANNAWETKYSKDYFKDAEQYYFPTNILKNDDDFSLYKINYCVNDLNQSGTYEILNNASIIRAEFDNLKHVADINISASQLNDFRVVKVLEKGQIDYKEGTGWVIIKKAKLNFI